LPVVNHSMRDTVNAFVKSKICSYMRQLWHAMSAGHDHSSNVYVAAK